MTLEAFLRQVQTSPMARYAIAMEAGFSLPVPVLGKLGNYAAMLILNVKAEGPGNTLIYKPEGAVVARYSDGGVAQLENYRVADPAPEVSWGEPLGSFPHDSVANWGRKRFEDERNTYFNGFELFFQVARSRTSEKNPAGLQAVGHVVKGFLTLNSPELIPYLLRLSPHFAAIVRKAGESRKDKASSSDGISEDKKNTDDDVLDTLSGVIHTSRSSG